MKNHSLNAVLYDLTENDIRQLQSVDDLCKRPGKSGRQKSLCASVKIKKLFQEISLVDSLPHAKTTDDSR
jgi:hypothetical protein